MLSPKLIAKNLDLWPTWQSAKTKINYGIDRAGNWISKNIVKPLQQRLGTSPVIGPLAGGYSKQFINHVNSNPSTRASLNRVHTFINPTKALNLIYNPTNSPVIAKNLEDLHIHRQKIRAAGHNVPYVAGQDYTVSTPLDFLTVNNGQTSTVLATNYDPNRLEVTRQRHAPDDGWGYVFLGNPGYASFASRFQLGRRNMGEVSLHEGGPGFGHLGTVWPFWSRNWSRDGRDFVYNTPGVPESLYDVAVPSSKSELYEGDLSEYQRMANLAKNELVGFYGQTVKDLRHVDPLKPDKGALRALVQNGMLQAYDFKGFTHYLPGPNVHRTGAKKQTKRTGTASITNRDMTSLSRMLNTYQEIHNKRTKGTATQRDNAIFDRLNILLNKGWDEARVVKTPKVYDAGSNLQA